MRLLSDLEIRHIKDKEFNKAIKILDEELGKKRVRNSNFLYEKFNKYPEFFLGIFLDNDLIGVISGFPREDYLLISEIAIDSKFQKRRFGRRLVEEFEKIAKKKDYKKINVGSDDKAVEFYSSLNYKPFLLVQYKKNVYFPEKFKLPILRKGNFGEDFVELSIKNPSLENLKNLRKKFPKAYFQYIFTKEI